MPSKLITAPTALAVSLDDAKANLRVDGTDMDALITAWIMGVTDHAEHYMGRAILNQNWRVMLDGFPSEIALPYPPVASVTAVTYLDANNVEQTLPANQYVLDNASEPCRLVPAFGVTWPATYDQINAVKVDIACGYGATAAATPQAIRLYLLAKLVEQFDPVVKPDKETVQSSYIDRLLDRYRIEEVG